MSTLLVTGSHGLVGQYLYRIRDTWKGKLVFTGKGPLRMPSGDLIYEEMDITDAAAIADVFERHRPDAVIHMAAMAQPDQCELNREEAVKVNVEATRTLLEAAAKTSAFFLYVSTDFVFSGNDGPYEEDSVPAPVNFYGNTKLMAEQLVRAYPHQWAIVRTVLVYGNVISGTRSNIISWVRGELEQQKPIKVVSDQLRAPTYAADLAAALLTIVNKRKHGVWHISGKDHLSPWDIAIMVAEYRGYDKNLITKVDASVFTQPATRPLRTPFIISKAVRELGYDPVSFEEGMRKVMSGL